MYEQQFNPFAANLAVVKGYFKNGKVMALGILYVLSAIISAISTVVVSLSGKSFINDFIMLMNQVDPALANEIQSNIDMNAFQSSSIVSVIFSVVISAALTILVAAAFFIIYSKSRNEDPQSTPLGGVNILYVLSVIAMVLTIIGFVLGIVCLVGMFLAIFFYAGELKGTVEASGYVIDLEALSKVLMPAYIVIAIISLIALIFGLVAVINRKRYYGSVKDSLTTVELQNKGAKGFGVICVISAIFTALSLFGSVGTILSVVSAGLSSASLIAAGSNFVGTLIYFIILILEARVALGYKRFIDDQKYGYRSTPYNAVQDGFAPPVDNGENPYADAPRQAYSDNYTEYSAPRRSYDDNYTDYGAPAQKAAGPMVCPSCGAPLEEDSAFCGNCGTRLK